MHTGYLWRNLKRRDHLKDLYKDGRTKQIVQKWDERAQTGLIGIRLGIRSRPLRIW